jgi:hypothetical protein
MIALACSDGAIALVVRYQIVISECHCESATSTYPSHFDFLRRHAMQAVLTQRRFTVVVPSFSTFLFLFLPVEDGVDSEEA